MLTGIANNFSTIVICLILLAVIGAILVSIIRNKKKGKTSCGCGCDACAAKDCCRGENK